MSDLAKLAKKIHPDWVKRPPKGKFGDYVPHYNINQLALLRGPYSFEVVELIRGFVPPVYDGKGDRAKVKYPFRDDGVLGVRATLTVTVDGEQVSVTEIGTEDNPAMHHDAENAKNAASDAYKRCWMRLGLGLHLWAQNDYKLDEWLNDKKPMVTAEVAIYDSYKVVDSKKD